MAKLSDKKKRWIKNEVKDFSFLLPSLVIFIIIIIIPLISGIRYTFTDWNGMSKDINYVGLKNCCCQSVIPPFLLWLRWL